MKTVFEGMVNGKVFNSVSEYNKALTEAIEKGLAINAQSNTYTVNENESGCCQCQKNPCECGIENADKENETVNHDVNFFYGMNENDDHYLDTLNGNDDDLVVINSWRNELQENLKEVIDYANKYFTIQDFNDYREDLIDVLKQLEEDKKNIDRLKYKFHEKSNELIEQKNNLENKIKCIYNDIDLIDKELNRLKSNRVLMDHCETLHKVFEKHYSILTGEMDGRDVNTCNDACNDTTDVCSCDCSDEEKQKEINKSFQKLLKSIFPSIE